MSIVSCQQVTIDHNEIGLIFKRFGGGASSSYKLEAGSYTIPKWNRVIIYNTALDSNSIDIVNEDLNYTISFSYHLDKKKMFFYHNYYGGDPATYAERAVKGVVMKESIEKLLCMSAKSIAQEFNSKRLLPQIQSDGAMPHEIARTRPLFYSIFNLHAMFLVASYWEFAEKLEEQERKFHRTNLAYPLMR